MKAIAIPGLVLALALGACGEPASDASPDDPAPTATPVADPMVADPAMTDPVNEPVAGGEVPVADPLVLPPEPDVTDVPQ